MANIIEDVGEDPIFIIDANIIGQGSYGCVYKPGIYVNNIDDNIVSKVLYTSGNFNAEKKELDNIEKIDGNRHFTLKQKKFKNNNKVYNTIKIDGILRYCPLFHPSSDNICYFINLEYGGKVLKDILEINDTFIEKLLPLFKGLQVLIKND